MESPEARSFAQFGGALILVSLALPWFALSVAGFGSESYRIWSFDKGAVVLVAAYGLLALTQVRLASRDATALIFLIVGGLMTAALIYKTWISPPGDAPIGSFGGVAGVSAKEILGMLGIELKPSYGAYVAFVGSVLFTVGAFLEFRSAGATTGTSATAAPIQPARPQRPAATGQAHQSPMPQAAARQIPPDPFAPPRPPGD